MFLYFQQQENGRFLIAILRKMFFVVRWSVFDSLHGLVFDAENF